jgi:hypothetical protein
MAALTPFLFRITHRFGWREIFLAYRRYLYGQVRVTVVAR